MTVAARLQDVCKDYHGGGGTVRALRNVSFTVSRGELVAIMGASGSGKSTLLNLLGCLDRPSEGKLWLGGDDVSRLTDDALSTIRGSRIGFVFQSFNLIPQLTVLENIVLPLYYQRRMNSEDIDRCEYLAARVGLSDRLRHRSTELSGGQQQRVAIARSLANEPEFLLADEPTGNLDTATTHEILELLAELNREGTTVIMVTHEDDVAELAQRVLRLKDGELESDLRRNNQ